MILEHDPFFIVEAMTIAGIATGCEHGYLYLRGEYPLAWERLVAAITAARARGFLGQDILGQGHAFDIELRKGAGAYICGEETALFNSIEGYRGEPRNKPPFPVDEGLFDKPTVINNVETLVNVPGIVMDGGQAYAQDRHRGLDGHAAVLPVGPDRAARPLRGAVRDHAARGARAGRRRARRAPAARDPAGRRGRALRHARRARHRDVVRGDAGGRGEHGLRRGDGDRRHRRHAGDPHAPRRVLPRRVVRPVRPVPGRHGAPGGGARPARRPAARAARSSRSTRCSTRSRPRCATRRSAGWARPPPTRSSRRCASSTSSRQGDTDEQDTDRRAAPDRRAHAQRRARHGAGGPDDPRRRAGRGDRDPDHVLGAHAHAGERLPGLRVRGQGRPHARAVLRAQGRGRDGGRDALRPREAQPQDGARVPRLVRRPVDDAERRALDRGVRRRSRALRAARPAVRGRRARPAARRAPRDAGRAARRHRRTSRRRSTTSSTCATTRSASSVTSASRAAAPTGRTRSPSPSPAAASTPGSRPSSPTRCPTPPACTAATASRCARPAR